MCDFYKNIITDKQYNLIPSWRLIELPVAFIMKDDVSNQYNFWIECDDFFYSGTYLKDIKYCPKC